MRVPAPPALLKALTIPTKLLMGPGPSNAPPRILQACAQPLLGHLHPEFCDIMDDVKAGVQYAFQTREPITFAVSATGHAAMESTVVNLVEPGDVVAVATNGIWGERYSDMVTRCGGVARQFTRPPGTVFSLTDIEAALVANKPRVLFITHGESSSCTCQPLEGIGPLCHQHGCLLVVDSVAAMGAVPLLMDEWEIDVLYTGSQKVLSVPPGTAPVSVSQRAWRHITGRTAPIQSFYLDYTWLANYWGCDDGPRKYHHTGPISSIYALREGLAILAEEGLEATQARHQLCAEQLYAGLDELGLELLVERWADRLPTVTGVLVPEGVNWQAVAKHAMQSHGVEIAGGLGPTAGRIWRVGIMGHNAHAHNVSLVLKALGEGMRAQHAAKL